MLVIRLQTPDDNEPAWALLEGAAADWTHGSWETLLPLARGQQVVLLIPSRDALLTSTNINTRNQRQLKQAIPYALEDALAGDPEDQHIVWQAHPDSTQVDVAIIERSRLSEWLASLRTRQLRANAILPDVFALPWESDTLTLWQQGEQVWIRTSELGGLACNSHTLPLIITSLRETNPAPLRLRLYADQPISWANDEHFTLIPEVHAEQLHAASLQNAMKLNLLHGWQAEDSARLKQQLQRWRMAAGLALAALLLGLGLYGINTYRLQQQLNALDAENLQLFAELFPDAASDLDPRGLKTRLESELLKLRGTAGESGGDSSLTHLATLAEALSQVDGLSVKNITTQSGSLSIELQTQDEQAVESLRTALESSIGGSVDLKTSRSADTIKANLTLGGKS
ncbi:MAG: hypothetical protein JG718_14505 [Candidatus Thiothrix moscowensis]|nr:hypothetical protein [Candidatus Thiothrix moscowensis]